MLFLLTPFLLPLSKWIREGEQWFNFNNYRPFLFQKRGEGGEQEKANSAKPRRGLMFTLLNVSLFNRVNPVKFAKQLFNRVNSHQR